MSTMNKEKLKGLQSFLKDDIWRVTEDEVSKSRGILYNAIKIATLSIREFTQGRILNKASALTYSTLLSIIPILAILFAIARGFGFSNLLETQFRSGLEGLEPGDITPRRRSVRRVRGAEKCRPHDRTG